MPVWGITHHFRLSRSCSTTLHSGSPGLRPSSVRSNIGDDTVNRIVQPTV